jgi:hypothetical protein
MRIALMVGLLGWFGLTGAAWAGGEKATVMDDFASSTPSKAWSVRPAATITYDKGGLRLKMPKYTGQQGEGKWPGMERSAADLPIVQYNGILIDLSNPTDHTQALQIGFKDRGSGAQLLKSVGPKEHRVVKVYFDKMISGIADWSDIQAITVTRTTPAAPQVWLIHRISLFCDNPATTEMGRLQALLHGAQAAFKQARSAGALSQRQGETGSETLHQWQKALQSPSGIRGKADECRNQLTALQSSALAAALAKQLDRPAVIWSVPLGTRFEPSGAMGQYQKPVEKLELFAAQGEYQDAVIRLTNLSDAVQDWRLKIVSQDPAAAAAMTVRQNRPVLAADRSVVGDVLTPLGGAAVVNVAPGQTAELWIAADVKHHEWAPGTHEAQLTFQDLRAGVSSRMAMPVKVTIRNFSLSAADPMHMCLWSYLYYSHAAPIKGREKAALANLVDYGCDVFVINGNQLPAPNLTPTGDAAAPMDLKEFDHLVTFYRSLSKSRILINLGLDDTAPHAQELGAHLKPYSAEWNNGMRNWLGQYVRRMHQLDVPTSDYAFYITDEPNESELDLTRVVAKIAKSIDPSVQIYMDSSEVYDNPKLNDELLSLVSINQPDGDGMEARPHLLPTLKKYPGLQLWMYECRTEVRSSQLVNAYDYYRLLAWRAQRDGMNGIGYWIYLYDSAKDLWDGTSGTSGSLVYPDADKGILMSPRWELIRTSLDDVKVYRLLQKAEQTPSVKKLLGERFADVIAHPHDPALAVQWRIDAGAAIEAAKR